MITIDTREDQVAINQLFLSDEKLGTRNLMGDFKFEKLDLGDFLIERNSSLLIERKTWPDFVRSMNQESGNGTLKNKLFRMPSLADETALLIEGSYFIDDDKVCIKWGNTWKPVCAARKIRRFLYHRQQETDCMLFYTNNLQETLHLILDLHDDLNNGRPPLKVSNWKNFIAAMPGQGRNVDKIISKYETPSQAIADIANWPRSKMEDEW